MNKIYSSIGLSLLATLRVAAYDVHLHNQINQETLVRIEYFGPGVCATERKIVPPNSERVVQTEHGTLTQCCVDSITVSISDSASTDSKEEFRFQPPRNMLGMSCSHMHVYINKTVDGHVIAYANLG